MPQEGSRLHLLTNTETDVLHWIAEGKSNHDIAVIMARSFGTIRTHVQNILRKLAVENRHSAALHYLQFTGQLRINA